MIYKIKYNPELTAIFKEEIIAAFSPSLVSHDKEEPTGVFSLDIITDYLDRKLLVTATEQDVVEINTLIEQGHSIKPTKIKNFFKTWQVSFPIVLLIVLLIVFLIYNNIK